MSISNISSRKFNISFNPTSSATKPAPAANTPEKGTPPGRPGMQFQDMFDTGSLNNPSSGNNEVSGIGPGSKAFGDKLHHAMESAGVDDETIKSVLAGLNGGGSPAETSASGEGGEDSVGGVTPGSRAFGDKLHHAMESAGVDDETIKTVLADLNGGQPASAQPDANGLDTLMSQLDGDSSDRLQSDGDSLEQLINNPELTAQLAQAPELFKLLMNQNN